jgi:hypothetical protein
MILLAACVCGVGLVCAVTVAPVDDSRVAAVFPPWWSPAEIFAAAGSSGQIVGSGLIDSILIVHSNESLLASRLRAHGALITMPTFRFVPCGNNSAEVKAL